MNHTEVLAFLSNRGPDSTVEELPTSQLDQGVRLRARGHSVDPQTMQSMAAMLEGGEKLPPVTVFQLEGGRLALTDGLHRVHAARRAKASTVPTLVYRGLTVGHAELHARWVQGKPDFSKSDLGLVIKELLAVEEVRARLIIGYRVDLEAIRNLTGAGTTAAEKHTANLRAELKLQRDADIERLYEEGKSPEEIVKALAGAVGIHTAMSQVRALTIGTNSADYFPVKAETELAALAESLSSSLNDSLDSLADDFGKVDLSYLRKLEDTLRNGIERVKEAKRNRVTQRRELELEAIRLVKRKRLRWGHYYHGNPPAGAYRKEDCLESLRRGEEWDPGHPDDIAKRYK